MFLTELVLSSGLLLTKEGKRMSVGKMAGVELLRKGPVWSNSVPERYVGLVQRPAEA